MKRIDALKAPLAAALLCLATMAGAERGGVEHRAQPVSAPLSSDAPGGHAVAGVDDAKRDPKHPDWLMVLAGLAVAGWIAQRRTASPLE